MGAGNFYDEKIPGFRKFLLNIYRESAVEMQHIKSQIGQYGIYLIFAAQAA